MLLLSGIIKNTCEGYKGSVLIEPEQAIEKADYKCGKSFYLDPILGTYKKQIVEDPIVDKILEMTQKAETDKIDFGLKKITNNKSNKKVHGIMSPYNNSCVALFLVKFPEIRT